MTCPCQKEIKQGKQVEFCSSHAFASLFLFFHSSASPLFLSTVSLFLLHFSCVGHLGFAASVSSAVSALFFHTLCCHSFSLQLLCAPHIFYLPPPLSSFHSHIHTPCPVAISCILFPFFAFSFLLSLTFLWSLLIWIFCTHNNTAAHMHPSDPTKPLPLPCINCSCGKDVCVSLLNGPQLADATPQ